MSKPAFQRSAIQDSSLFKAEQAFQRRDFKRCIEHSRAFLARHPEHTRALRLNAYACIEAGDKQQALDLLERTLKIEPNDFKNLLNAAKLHIQAGSLNLAIDRLESCQRIEPDDSVVQLLKGECLTRLDRKEEAMQTYNRIIEKNPQLPQAYYKLAILLQRQKHENTALELIDMGIALIPEEYGLWHLKAMLLRNQEMHGLALKIFENLEKTKGYDLASEIDHANTLKKLKKYEEAKIKYESVLLKSPGQRQARLGLGGTLYECAQYDEALKIFLELHNESPEDSEVLMNISGIYGIKRDHINSNKFYRLAFQADPKKVSVAGSYLYSMSYLCDWKDYEIVKSIINDDANFRYSKPFPSILYDNNPRANQAYAEHQIAREIKNKNIFEPIKKYSKKEKIRVGYYSSDFYTHATVMLIEGMLRAHDRNEFELHAFSLDLTPPDASHQRVRELFDHFHDVYSISDNAVTYLSRKHEIDIAIDLKGFTQGRRTAIFSERAAPIQVNYLGFPGTMGASFIDYIVADPFIITSENRDYFNEKVIYMPDCYQPNTPQRPKPSLNAERPKELPPNAFVYCSFNNIYKLTPTQFDLWLKILRQTPNSVLWLLRTTKEAEANLLKYVSGTDIDPSRIIFAPLLPEAQHLQRVSFADCFLDSFPCNAHTTASDAVWAGVPLVTKSGHTFASRVAGSIMKTLHLTELITDNDIDYEEIAIKLYKDKNYLLHIKNKIKKEIKSGPLYKSEQYTRNFESALHQIYETYHANLEKSDIHIINRQTN